MNLYKISWMEDLVQEYFVWSKNKEKVLEYLEKHLNYLPFSCIVTEVIIKEGEVFN